MSALEVRVCAFFRLECAGGYWPLITCMVAGKKLRARALGEEERRLVFNLAGGLTRICRRR